MANTEQNAPRLLSVHELAKHFGVSPKFVYDRTAPRSRNQIPHYKLGKFVRFRLDEVEQWLAEQGR